MKLGKRDLPPEECDQIIRYGESLSPQDSVVGLDEDSQEVEEEIRKSKELMD